MPEGSTDALAGRLIAGERRALAKAITLVESTRAEDRAAARALMAAVAPHAGGGLRLGLSGTPGVGKSTFIEAFGMMLVEAGHKVAVLAVDPSSARSGGSILGDKTRMDRLSRHPGAFIRPSPAGRELGGVARRTREAIRLVEAAGFDTVIVETVGVGQSETMVAEMTDLFVLLLAPAGGDELQGVKRGIMEIADIIVVNKADGPLREVAERTRADYAGALRLMRAREGDAPGFPKALAASAATGAGLTGVWDEIRALDLWRREQGWRDRRRARQAVRWLRAALERSLIERLYTDEAVAARLPEVERAVARGEMVPEDGADQLLSLLLGRIGGD
ncbi:methylmalonyl Co-A mutase-associated GTPase MeaB [Limibaculum sp. FT325]|uniref:methylmalonyl Co-A mutase-associated GTPase MeaB n=1 Tax=Thermohalobaculum sediminis TaxID=2939436 RepID=UPI0020BE57D5|nr:methylmalonyl Co-A mutase-associated GTPase MeaB [Limibaculum sediminis]MCL5777153.1 methylmalonyl Co-A mutase-associated GTPase MeaB [Limibaculum sediminis]